MLLCIIKKVATGYAVHEREELFEDTEKRADDRMYEMKKDYYTRTRKQKRE